MLEGPDPEIDANGADVTLGICVVGDAEEEAGLANSRVTNDNDLERFLLP